jgi:hypothetical protein
VTVFGVIALIVLALAVGLSIGYLVRDLRKLHRRGRALTEAPSDASGVSAAGMTFIGNIGTH